MSIPQKILNQQPLKPEAITNAVLSDGTKSHTFMYDLISDWAFTGEDAKLPVLNTDKPYAKRKYATSSVKFPSVLMTTPGANKDMSEGLNLLTDWVKKGTDLTFTSGTTRITRCRISSWTFKIIQTRAGKPTHVEGSLDLMILNDKKSPSVTVDDKQTQGITDREREQLAAKLADGRKNAVIAKKLKITNPKDLITVDKTGTVTIKNPRGETLGTFKIPDLKSLGIIR